MSSKSPTARRAGRALITFQKLQSTVWLLAQGAWTQFATTAGPGDNIAVAKGSVTLLWTIKMAATAVAMPLPQNHKIAFDVCMCLMLLDDSLA